jgi:hypothetical protein
VSGKAEPGRLFDVRQHRSFRAETATLRVIEALHAPRERRIYVSELAEITNLKEVDLVLLLRSLEKVGRGARATRLTREATRRLGDITDFLRNKGIFVEERPFDRTEPRDERWDRQVRFFNSFESHASSGLDFHARLRAARVVVLGAGGFGSWLAFHLGMIGIGNLIIIDFDTIEMSNLGRCPFYRVSQIAQTSSSSPSATTQRHTLSRARLGMPCGRSLK